MKMQLREVRMTIPTSKCADRESLIRFLQEKLAERDESIVREHLGECPACQSQLEEIVAASTDWEFARNQLSRDPFTRAGITDKSLTDSEWDQLEARLGPTDNPDMLGRLGCYEVCGVIGQGSTATVLKAYEPRLSRYVAIKVLSPTIAAKGTARSRFEREAKSIAAVADQHVVPIYSVDEYQGLPFIVMKYVVGGSLQQKIELRGPLSTLEVARLGLQIAKGLQAAHEIGIVHRDVKPPNVLLEGNGERALVGDFGLARVADDIAITRSGTIAGTPQFMSPEQARGEPVDARSDLFSLASVMYAACTGHPPFESETTFGVLKRVSDTEPRPIHDLNPDIAPWLVAFIGRLHAKNRADRIQSAEEAVEILGHEIAHLTDPLNISQPVRPWLLPARKIDSRVWKALGLGPLVAVVTLVGLTIFGQNSDREGAATMDRNAATESIDTTIAIAKQLSSITIDGNLSDWPEIRRYPISAPYITNKETADAGFSGEFRIGIDETKQFLLVAVETSDDAVRLQPVCDDNDWSVRDACELYCYPQSLGIGAPVQFTFRDKPAVAIADNPIRELGRAVTAARKSKKKGLIYEWQIDLNRLNNYLANDEAAVYHFDVVCVDRDSRSRIAVFSWTRGRGLSEATKHLRSDELGTLALEIDQEDDSSSTVE